MNARKTDLLKQTASATPRRLHLRDPQEAELPAYSGVGTDLRASRQRAQLDIAGLAGHLRIQPSYLEAIEEGRFEDLPGTPYALGFVRSYAAFFDLDADELVRRFKEEASLTPPNRRLVFPEPVEQPQRPRAWLVVLCLVVAAAGFAGWRYLENRGRADIAAVTPPPERLASLVAQADAPSSGAGTAAPPVMAGREPAGEAVATAQAAPAPTGSTLPIAAPQVATSATGAEPAASPDHEADRAFESTGAPVSASDATSASGATADAPADRTTIPEMPALARAAVEVARLTTEAERASLQRRAASAPSSPVATTPSSAPTSTDASTRNAVAGPDAAMATAVEHASATAPDSAPSSAATEQTADRDTVVTAAVAPAVETATTRTAPLPASRDVERRRISSSPDVGIAEPRDEAVVSDPAHDTVGEAPVSRTGPPPGGEAERDIVVVDPPVRRRVGAEAAARQENAVAAIVPAVPERSGANESLVGDDSAGDVSAGPRVARVEAEAPPSVAEDGGDAAPSAPQLNSGRQPQVFGASNADARVVIRARADSWVQVQGDDNELLLTRMLRMGDTFRVPDRDDLVLMTGNAGAIDVIVDGRRLGPLGPNGEVRRNVPLTAEALSRIAASRGG